MYHHRNMILEKPQGICRAFIVYLIDVLHFDKMVATPECALLRPSALIRLRANPVRVGAVNASTRLYPVQVRNRTVSFLNRPARPFEQKLALRIRAEPYLSL